MAVGPVAGAVAAAVGFAALVAVGYAHDRRLRAVVREVAETAERAACGDPGGRAPASTGDEVEELSHVLDHITAQLDEHRAILHGIEAGIILVGRDHRIVWHNALAERWFGLRGADLPPCYRAAFGRDAPCPDCLAASCFATGATKVIEVVRDGPEGPRHYHVTNSPVRGRANEVTGVLKLIRDVTERRALEIQLRQSENLARLGELAATVVHEIKNPLAGIRAAIELAARDLPEGSRGEKAVPRIVALIERLDATVRDLLVFVRPASLTLARADLAAIVDDAIALVRPNRAVSRVTIRRGPSDPLPPVRADAAALRQVFANLVLNAAEAMERLPPAEAELQVSFADGDGGATVEIADRGPGVPAEVRPQLFKPFFTTKPQGTGLGLVVSRRLVEAHGGTITLESASGAGTRVRVRLPAEEVVA